jgi:NADPH:quinone reductase-like Zn-dependent oxidoreductase
VTSPLRARAFWTLAPGTGAIRDETIDAPGTADLLVRTEFSAISRGTEALVFNGRVPASEYDRMRAPFQAGTLPGPIKYGYSNVGVVEQGPPELVGRRTFSLFPHQTRYVVPVTAAFVIPDEVPSARAVLAANMETAITGLWDARPHVGDRITVIGAGVVGALVAWLAAQVIGCEVTLVDVNPAREALAQALGVRFTPPDAMAGDADVVVHASGAPGGLTSALNAAGFEATLVEMSWYGDQIVPAPLGGAFHARRISMISSQVGHIPPAQRARWSHRRRLTLALSLLKDARLDALITSESEFDSLPDVMKTLAAGAGTTLCHRIRYS